MDALYDEKTIIACSTGSGINSAIAVLRLTGFSDIRHLQKFFSKNLQKISSRKAYMSDVLDENEVLDKAVITYYKAPLSYTGENIIEISVHGNRLNVRKILDLFAKEKNIRIALPGEFTYRAMKNKKMSLSQVEGLDLFLNATTGFMLKQGINVIQGELNQKYHELYEALKIFKASLEILIDFSEDVGEEDGKKNFITSFESFENILEFLYKRTQGDHSQLLTPSVVIVGQANAGKSTLFNALLDENRAIVSKISGTTRDYITEYINIFGNEYKLIDTAGIRKTEDVIEREGIRRTVDIISKAFFKILVINPFETSEEDFEKIKEIDFDLTLIAHIDKKGWREKFNKIQNLPKTKTSIELSLANIGGSIEPGKSGPIEPNKSGPIEPNKSGPIEPDHNSIGYIPRSVNKKYVESVSGDPIVIERQKNIIQQIHHNILNFKEKMVYINDVAVLSSELRIIEQEISQLIGIIPVDEVMSSIFENFCIGK